MSIVLVGSTSGSVTLQEPAVAGTTVLTLPAVSGTILTTGSSGQSIPKAALPTGSVLQVVQTYKTDSFSTNATSYTNVTGLSASITPTSATSKILVMVSVFIDGYQNQNFIALTRNGSLVGQSTAGSSFNSLANAWGQNSGSDGETLVANYLDSPATTSALTYQVQAARQNSGSSPLLINVVVNGTYGGVSSITLMEIAA